MYVALSRARSLEGMSLVDLDLSRLRAHPKVLAFHRRVPESARARPKVLAFHRRGGDTSHAHAAPRLWDPAPKRL